MMKAGIKRTFLTCTALGFGVVTLVAFSASVSAQESEELLSLPPIEEVAVEPAPSAVAVEPLLEDADVGVDTSAPATPEDTFSDVSAEENIPVGGEELSAVVDTEAGLDEEALEAGYPQENGDSRKQATVGAVVNDPRTPWSGSLMFSQKRVNDLMSIHDAYLANLARLQPKDKTTGAAVAGVDVTTIIGNLQGGDGQPVVEEVLDMTLNSILYRRAGDWSIWVNGKRYSQEEATGGFLIGKSAVRVLNVSEREAVMVWRPMPESFARVGERWQAKQAQQSEGSVRSPLMAQNERVEFSVDEGNVIIALRPNQTFISRNMSVLEGSRPSLTQGVARDTALSEGSLSVGEGGEVPYQQQPASGGDGYYDDVPPVVDPNHSEPVYFN